MSALMDQALTGEQLAACVLADRIDRLLDEQSIIRNATVFKARCGSRKAFPTRDEALAFEAGYDAYRWGQICPADKPASTGWLEAERDYEGAQDMVEDERRAARERA